MPISREIAEAVAFLSSLQNGDAVNVTQDGRTYAMTVRGYAHLSDGAYGSVESTRVTVTLGPGRWSTDVTAEGIAAGKVKISRA